jgi:hypothetical protein
MQEYPVRVGRMLFTMVDPHVGHEVAYNRWYERDHFYAGCMIGPGWFAGARWVAPRALKDLRFPEKSPFADPVDAGSYLSIYWVDRDHVEAAFDWAGKQVVWLYQNGRGFNERTHAHTALYDFASVTYADPGSVPVELALDHHYPGLAVVVVEPAGGTSREALQNWLERGCARSLLDSSPASMIATWTLHQRARAEDAPAPPMSLGADGGSGDRLVQLAFLEDEPVGAWQAFRDYARAIDVSGKGAVTFAAPFLRTVVGTDTYTDKLWSS